MKTVAFSVKKTDGSLIDGYLINQNKNSSIAFATADIPSGNLVQNNIKDVSNFIAAYVKKMARSKNYVSIIIDDKETEILWIKPTEENDLYSIMYSHEKLEGQLLSFENGLVSLKDISGNTVSVSPSFLGFKEVKVPKKQQYTTEPILNEIFALNGFPYDYNRQLNNKILETIKRYKKRNCEVDIYFSEYGSISFVKSKYHPFVIPAKFFK